MQKLFAIFVFGSFIAAVSAGMQSTAIAGTVTCNEIPQAAIKIELWDKDTIDPDDLMANTTTFSDGGFYLEGKESELTTIDPEVRMYVFVVFKYHGRPKMKVDCAQPAAKKPLF
uniref:Uncharacterized protein n=1 Tax=Panagrolaimus davidi TaxID=227884 RepID=A0A914QAV7_9BILA